METKKYKISFCIVCKNRLYQLEETLIQNIRDNEDYDNLEFILLDYNSEDGMEDWAKENLAEYILNGKLTYYRTTEPQGFSHSHSKNLAFKLADGDIVCNVHADHYTGKGFADYTNEAFNRDENIILTTIDFYKTKKDYFPAKDVLGKVCVRKSDFLKINGFDERMQKYAFEDYDFINRLEMLPLKRTLIEAPSFLNFISHEEEKRYSPDTDNLDTLFVAYSKPSISELVFLFKDQKFEKGTMIDNFTIDAEKYVSAYQPKTQRYEHAVKEPGWTKGTWNKSITNRRSFSFLADSGDDFTFIEDKTTTDLFWDEAEGLHYYIISNPGIIKSMMEFRVIFHNRDIMEKNLDTKRMVCNRGDFGKATVFKNFQSKPRII